MKKIMICIGTRPEAIKLFPVINALKADSRFDVRVCSTGQHRELLAQVFLFADVVPAYNLDVMRDAQTLTDITVGVISKMANVLKEENPDYLIVQGDTTTAFVASLAAFYHKTRILHVEAGLRTGNKLSPWPEEANRRLITVLADLHFAPTENAKAALVREGIDSETIWVTGNTVIDALITASSRLSQHSEKLARIDAILSKEVGKKIILVTAHRRENHNEGMDNIASALHFLAKRPDVVILFPVHPNPAVRSIMKERLSGIENIYLIEPLEYVEFIYALRSCYIVLTDSGGVQEEAPTFGKPVLVMRETSERPEGIAAGTARLVGSDYNRIISEVEQLLDDQHSYMEMAMSHNPFGDGRASERIVNILARDAANR